MSLLATVHDPWLGLCLGIALGERLERVVTFGDATHAAVYADAGVPVVLVPRPPEATTLSLLGTDEAVAAIPKGARLLVFKPSRRLEERAAALGASLAHSPASIAQGLENKLALEGIAAEAGIALPAQRKIRVRDDLSFDALSPDGAPVVVQSPRGFMGKRTWRVSSAAEWAPVRATLRGRPAKVTQFVTGRPGTVNAVVDHAGATLVTAPIVQVTGEPWLTPFPLGSCGNDFTWRPLPHPGDGPATLVQRLGPVLAARGYRGHFGIDVVVEKTPGGSVTWLIEINPRLTASMALYAAWCPVLAHAHVDAVSGEALPQTGELPPVRGGQLIVHNTTDGVQLPLSGEDVGLVVGGLPADQRVLWPHVATRVEPGGTRGRIVAPGVIVDAAGDVLRG